MNYFRFDTETNLIVPGLAAPEIICIQYARDDGPVWLKSHVDPGFLEEYETALNDPQCLLEAWNSPFDHAVIAAHRPELIGPIFRMLGQMRGRDSMLLAKLSTIQDGSLQAKPPPKFDLARWVKALCGGKELSKGQDSWRYRYATLKGLSAEDYPTEAVDYAMEDVVFLREVSERLRERFESPDEWLQVAAAFALHLAACWGVRCDRGQLETLEDRLLTENVECQRILTDAGFFSDGSVSTKAVQCAVEAAYGRLGEPVPRTAPSDTHKNGQVKTNEETLDEIERVADPALQNLIQYKKNQKNLSTYIAPMKGGINHAMNSRPNVLVATGRTSWGASKLELRNPWDDTIKPTKIKIGTNLQNFPKLKGVRECIIPRAGYWFLSVDYGSLELRTLAQVCLWAIGRSTFANGYRKDPDWDPHSYFAGHLTGVDYASAIALKKAKDKTFAKERAVAKNINFALPGGVGAKKFVKMAELAGIIVTLEQAQFYKNEWLAAFSEMVQYFKWISDVANHDRTLKQFVSGRIRGDVGYTDGCNTLFQGLAADLAKRALFSASMACYAVPSSPLYGSRIIAFIHDELVIEVPAEKGHEAAMETVRIMNEEFVNCCPDIPPSSEPALMTCWCKEASPRYENGRLIAWDL